MFSKNKLMVPGLQVGRKSKSMETLSKSAEVAPRSSSLDRDFSDGWETISLLKSAAPCIMCILPHLSKDLVCSALLAAGPNPLVTEDALDIERDLENSKAIVVDVSAPKDLLEAFIDSYEVGTLPLVLVVSQAGSSDRKRDLAVRIIEECSPVVVSGRRGDIYAVAQVIIEKLTNKETQNAEAAMDGDVPTVILEGTKKSPARYRKRSPAPSSQNAAINKKSQGKEFKRLGSVLPLVKMKGQFRESCMKDVCVQSSLKFAQLLSAHINAFVHLYEATTVTNGEMVVGITAKLGSIDYLHSQTSCCGAILAAVMSCSISSEISIKTCVCGLALYYAAVQEAAAGSGGKDVPPGTLTAAFLDKLYLLDDVTVRSNVNISAYLAGVCL